MILQWRKLQLAQEHNNNFTSWDETQISLPHAHLHEPGSAPRPYQPRVRLRAVILKSPLPLPALAAKCRVTAGRSGYATAHVTARQPLFPAGESIARS